MIQEIRIASGTATYGPNETTLPGLTEVNFIFGSNGTGKTTIGRIIADPSRFSSCSLVWKDNSALRTMVYNRDFVAKYFHQNPHLKGVFTLGEAVGIQAEIDKAVLERDDLTEQIRRRKNSLDDPDAKPKQIECENIFQEECWRKAKEPFDKDFKDAFEGLNRSKEKFKQRVISEYVTSTAALRALPELKERASILFGDNPATEEQPLGTFQTKALEDCENDPVLQKIIVGKSDLNISQLIHTLSNSDWVREGTSHFAKITPTCPFCQQETSEEFRNAIEQYFDGTFEADTRKVAELEHNYNACRASLAAELKAISSTSSNKLDKAAFKLRGELLVAAIESNLATLAEKKAEPSRKFSLKPIGKLADDLRLVLKEAEDKIAAHNKIVRNAKEEKEKLVGEIWKYLVAVELDAAIQVYFATKEGADKKVKALETKIVELQQNLDETKVKLAEFEAKATGVDATMNAINAMLKHFGFHGFALARVPNSNNYRLERADKQAADETLSEGEKTFLTFLYFYHLLHGSEAQTGITDDRIAVVDDPVSSLDSDVLFIVSSLVRGIVSEINEGEGRVKQIIVLTHNVYFHKEVTFDRKKPNQKTKPKTFWLVRKPTRYSTVEKFENNPVSTSYQLLWREVQQATPSPVTIQNTLRRILENYFKILGDVDLNGLPDDFTGDEKLICRSLVSWIHDGSHYTHDDAHFSLSEGQVAKYLEVFRKIFEKKNHGAHYEMMMAS